MTIFASSSTWRFSKIIHFIALLRTANGTDFHLLSDLILFLCLINMLQSMFDLTDMIL